MTDRVQSILAFIRSEGARFQRAADAEIVARCDPDHPAVHRLTAQASLSRTFAAQIERGDDLVGQWPQPAAPNWEELARDHAAWNHVLVGRLRQVAAMLESSGQAKPPPSLDILTPHQAATDAIRDYERRVEIECSACHGLGKTRGFKYRMAAKAPGMAT